MKKYIYFDLFHLSLVLSLLRLYPNLYREVPWTEPYGQEVYLGNSAAYTQARFHNFNNHQLNGFEHPKNVDNTIERTLFIRDVNSIYRSRYWSSNSRHRERNVFAYILNELRPHSVLSTPEANADTDPNRSQSQTTNTELTQADLDLIEILWKQDIDMGVSREMFDETLDTKESSEKLHESSVNISTSGTSYHNFGKDENYGIDSETGEHVKFPMDSDNNPSALVPNNHIDVIENESLSLFESETLQGDDKPVGRTLTDDIVDTVTTSELTEDMLFDPDENNINLNESLLEQLHDLQQMVSEAHVDPYPEDFRAVHSDYLDLSADNNNTENNTAILDALLQNTSLVLPLNDSLLNMPFPAIDEFSLEHETDMNTLLTFLSDDSDPNPVGAVGGQESTDVDPDLVVGNLTVDNTFLSQLMNGSSLEFSDFCNMPVKTPSEIPWPASTSSDSAVSSMGSDWSDSCSGESRSDDLSMQDYTSLDTDISSDQPTTFNNAEWNFSKSFPNMPRKFHLLGEKCNDKVQSTSVKNKFLCKLDSPDEEYKEPSSTEENINLPRLAVVHNHTYHNSGDTVTGEEASQKHLEKTSPKSSSQKIVSSRGTRDDKRLLSTKLPLTVKEIVELPIEQFNERLTKLRLSDEHLSLIRDIRRRGKNKVAARTCRKRKVDQILDLNTVVEDLKYKRDLAYANMEQAIAHRDLLKQKYQRLHQFIFPDCDPPDPAPATFFSDNSVLPPISFPLSSNTTNDTEHKKRGKHKGTHKH